MDILPFWFYSEINVHKCREWGWVGMYILLFWFNSEIKVHRYWEGGWVGIVFFICACSLKSLSIINGVKHYQHKRTNVREAVTASITGAVIVIRSSPHNQNGELQQDPAIHLLWAGPHLEPLLFYIHYGNMHHWLHREPQDLWCGVPGVWPLHPLAALRISTSYCKK